MTTDLTVSEAVSDPLIALLRRADGVENAAFAALLREAARLQLDRRIDTLREKRASHFYKRLAATGEENRCAC